MAFIKLIKNKAYYKRFQVKYRRRREGKTDYTQRQHLVTQDKNKYNTPKYRYVVRITNTAVIAQIVYSKVVGDFVLCSAYSHELPRYGVALGLTNYSAAYCTGLLLARRLLAKLSLDKKYEGVAASGDDYLVSTIQDGPRPFKALFDIGLARTTTGARIFGALKGACDGGIFVPHNEKRFPGYNGETKKYDPEVHRKHIFGVHIADYMKSLSESDNESFQKQFSRYVKAGVKPESIEGMYKSAHAAIRANPAPVKKERKELKVHKWRRERLTLKARKSRVEQKRAHLLKVKAAEASQ